MFKKVFRYILRKITSTGTKKLVRWGFWGLVLTFPGGIISTVGLSGLSLMALFVHSGIVEYSVSKTI